MGVWSVSESHETHKNVIPLLARTEQKNTSEDFPLLAAAQVLVSVCGAKM